MSNLTLAPHALRRLKDGQVDVLVPMEPQPEVHPTSANRMRYPEDRSVGGRWLSLDEYAVLYAPFKPGDVARADYTQAAKASGLLKDWSPVIATFDVTVLACTAVKVADMTDEDAQKIGDWKGYHPMQSLVTMWNAENPGYPFAEAWAWLVTVERKDE